MMPLFLMVCFTRTDFTLSYPTPEQKTGAPKMIYSIIHGVVAMTMNTMENVHVIFPLP